MDAQFVLEAIVVLAAILLGTRSVRNPNVVCATEFSCGVFKK